MAPETLTDLTAEIVSCRQCPRLVAWREEAAANPPSRFAVEQYWALPLPGWGDSEARVLALGLAPAANGGNRTGRIFTGDSSGDFLFASLHRTGFANQPTSISPDDGLTVSGLYIAAVVRCAPTTSHSPRSETAACRIWSVSCGYSRKSGWLWRLARSPGTVP
jgi:uracil-DNA glycosylase